MDPGIHLVGFWQGVHRMNTQTLENKEDAATPTREGLTVKLDASLIYHLSPAKALRYTLLSARHIRK